MAQRMKQSGLKATLFVCLTSLLVSAVYAQDIMSDIPFKPDVDAKYLIYQHSKFMEKQGIPAKHKKIWRVCISQYPQEFACGGF